MARLELRGVEKTYRGGIAAAKGVDLAVEGGEMFVVVGPSGSGKSTLLRLIAGLEPLDSGSIFLGDRRIDQLPPRNRGLAMVFQDAVVYPHLDVFENIAFGLRARRVGRDEIRDRVDATADMLGLTDALGRSPTTLSGGQKRRVTLARALVLRPGLFLFDEPFSGLDAPLRASIRTQIADLHRQLSATMILVTHDQGEALALADRIAVLDAGRVVQVGRPLEVYEAPKDRFVARFFGQPPMAMIPCAISSGGLDSIRIEPAGLHAPWSVSSRSAPGVTLANFGAETLDLGLRAEQVAIAPTSEMLGISKPGWLSTSATVDRLEPSGSESTATLRLGPNSISARIPARSTIRVGDEVAVKLDLDRALWFDPSTGARVG